MAEPMIGRLALIGVGLIGSSIARSARRGGLAGEIVGCARRPETRARCLELGLVDAMHEDPAAAVEGADLVIMALHLGFYEEVAKRIAPALKPGAIVSDVGSVKANVFRDVAPHLPAGVHLVPGHPVSGTEKSGPDAGFAELFDDRWCILTPADDADPAAVDTVARFWTGLGSKVETMDARRHDLVLAVTSHLPHLIAYTIVGTAFDLQGQEQRDVIRFSAGGFRDITRIAGSNPIMWRDIFLNNREAVLEMLQRFSEDLSYLQRAIRWGEGDKLEELFTKTREIRRGVVEANQAQPFPYGGNGQ